MLQQEAIWTGIPHKTVLLLADCWGGALLAGHFTAKLLFDRNTRVILLHTFQQPATGKGPLRNMTSVLKKIAMEDLSVLKDKLINEFGLPEESILKVALEGDLRNVITKEFCYFPNLSIVMGPDTSHPLRNGTCRKVIRALRGDRPRPVFLVSDHITIIESSRIIVITENEENLSDLYLVFLKELFGKNSPPIEIISRGNSNTLHLNEKIVNHFSENLVADMQGRQNLDRIIFDFMFRVKKSSPD
jgi:hypothetical protein